MSKSKKLNQDHAKKTQRLMIEDEAITAPLCIALQCLPDKCND